MININKIKNWRPNLTEWIIIANVIFTLGTWYLISDETFYRLAGFSFYSEHFEIWQPLTSMFMHGSFFHLFINMFCLWTFSKMYERMLTKTKYLILYFGSGLGGYLLTALLSDPSIPGVGASGAIFGFLGAAMILTPNAPFQIIFFPFVSFKAKHLVSVVMVGTLIFALIGGGSIGHWCHFGGGIVGILLAGFWITKKIPNLIRR